MYLVYMTDQTRHNGTKKTGCPNAENIIIFYETPDNNIIIIIILLINRKKEM